MIQTILIGLISLGIIIFIHELGHFLTAKAFGITVEAFALGWGRKLVSFRRGETEYRINVFPMGGYCRMKGEEEFRQALAAKLDSFIPSPGSLFSVSPMKRLATYAAGPISNFLLAGFLLTCIWWIGYSYTTFENRIILTSEYPQIYSSSEQESPAVRSGLQTGDQVVRINDTPIETFSDLQRIITLNPERELSLSFLRNGQLIESTVIPDLNRSTGSGYIGVAPFITPAVSELKAGGPAEEAGIQPGDIIVTAGNIDVSHTIDMYLAFRGTPGSVELTVLRNGSTRTLTYIPRYDEQGQVALDFTFSMVEVFTPDYNFFQSIGPGFAEALDTFFLTIKSIGVLFRGVDTAEAVAGPVRITYLVGDAAAQGFQAGFKEGIITLFRLIGFISIALSFANLLPIPALDGGQIVLSLYEAARGRMISPRKYYVLQLIGFSVIMFIFFFALMNDISFLARGR